MEESEKKSKNAKFPEIGERISEFLRQNGIKKSFVAKKLGKTPQAVSFVTTGGNDAQLDLLLFLVSQGCDAHWLLTGERKVEAVTSDDRLSLVLSVWGKLTRFEKAAIVALAEGVEKRE